MPRPLIIGQAPAQGNDALPPFSGQSGARLARLAGVGDTGDVLPNYFQLINLVEYWPGKTKSGRGDLLPRDSAQAKANKILSVLMKPGTAPRFVLLIGANVSDFMGFSDLPMLGGRFAGGHHFIKFPHPSGASSYWNDRTQSAIAGFILRGVLHHGRS